MRLVLAMATQFVIFFFFQLHYRLWICHCYIPVLNWGMSLMNIRKDGHLSWWSLTNGLSFSDCPLSTKRQINQRELLSRSPCQWLTKRQTWEGIVAVIDSVIIMANMLEFGIYWGYECLRLWLYHMTILVSINFVYDHCFILHNN